MTASTTLAAYAVALAAVFGAGLAIGELVGPVGTAGAPPSSETGTGTEAEHSEMEMTR